MVEACIFFDGFLLKIKGRLEPIEAYLINLPMFVCVHPS
jgi:hypothetical protein